ncbi:hypothetical protein GCM10020331_053120 [Ectobacillus funiculus]
MAAMQSTENGVDYQQIQKLVEQIDEYGKKNIAESVFVNSSIKERNSTVE